MVFVQKWPFFLLFFFRQYRPGKCLLLSSRAKKNLFQATITRSSKRQKIKHFSKGVKPWFWSKNGHFSKFFFYTIQPGKMSFTILQSENTPLQALKTTSSKRQKIKHFSKGVKPWFWSKHGHFSNFFFLGNIGQENVFYDILERKDAFLNYKYQKFKKS